MINDINNLELVDDDYIEYKIILIGDSSVGKTCLFKKIGTGEYFGKTVSTVGVDKKSLQFVYEFEENDFKNCVKAFGNCKHNAFFNPNRYCF